MKQVSLSSLFFLLLLAVSLSSCGEGDTTTKGKSAVNDVEIPALLPRPVALQNAVEWDKTQSSYMQLSSDLRLKDEYAIEPRITLAQIFANEARVTGEHGHYYPAALKMVNEALEINKGLNPDQEFLALSTKASVQLSQHEFEDALVTAKRAIALNPYNAQIYGALIDANVELGNYEDAVAASDKMVKTRPDLRSYSRVSYLREIHGDIPGAIKAMQMAVNAGAPGYESTAWARLTLGELYHRYGESEKAKKQYQSILVERPKYPFAIAALAELEMDNKNYDEAEKLLDEAASIIPEVGYYIQLAELYKATGREEEMKTKEKEIFEMLQDDVDSGHNMDLEYASFYRDHFEDYDKALDYTKKEYEKRPANIDVNRMMASLYVKKGMESEAASFLEKANATQSRHPELQELLAAR